MRPSGESAGHAIPGRQPVAEALAAGRALRSVLVEESAAGGLAELLLAAERAGVPVRRAGRARLDEAAQGVRHQGVVAFAGPFPYLALADVAVDDLAVVLDGVTDPQNLGSIARSAELAGAQALVLPRRRSAHVTPAAEKAASGAFSRVPVVVVPNIARALADLAERGVWSVGLDGEAPVTLWDSRLLDEAVAIVVGAEGKGLSRLVAERVDERVSIPMRGRLGSLNAGVAAGVALFEVVRRRRIADS
jgi:23S rRNA (guanosine2251-2'-O)-methyltransferase